MRYASIMAGGSGTRLWPMSRTDLPKQLIPFVHGRSLLEIAVDRLQGMVEPHRQFICSGQRHRKQIHQTLPEFADTQILGEPEGRDTLAAVGLSAAVAARQDPDAVVAVFTADHLIEPIELFRQRVEIGFRIAEQRSNALVTFGIEPTRAATGFGYVELGEPLEDFEGAFSAKQFVEKPDASTAQTYVDSGRYAWNSGMFVWRAATLLDCIRRYKPQVHAGLLEIAGAWETDRRQAVLEAVYPRLEKISVDFAVMEPASTDPAVEVVTVAMPVEWLDVGSWPAYGETLVTDDNGNRQSHERVLLVDGRDNLVVSDDPNHLIAAIGISDLVVVHTSRATLICHRDQAEAIKQLHERIGQQHGDEYV